MTQDSNSNSIFKAGLIGAAIGAAAVALAHKPTREKVLEKIDTLGGKMDELKTKGAEKVGELKVKASLAQKEAEDMAEDAGQRAKKALKEVQSKVG